MQLREYAQRACRGTAAEEPILHLALRRQAAQAMAWYGVHVHLDIDASIACGDRLSAEVLQIVREAISNICRHTTAKQAAVSLRCCGGLLRIAISNENDGPQAPLFRPRSISERAAALGGCAYVSQGRIKHTIVHVEIPL